MEKNYEISNAEWVAILGERFRDYRIAMQLTQRDVAEQAGVSLPTIRHFEHGSAVNLSLSTLVALLRTIHLLENIEQLLPPLPQDPMQIYNHQTTKPQRVRK